MALQDNQLLKAQISVSLKNDPSSASKVYGPKTIASFFLVNNAYALEGLSHQFRAKIVMRLCILIAAFVSEELHGSKIVLLANHLFHESPQTKV